MVFGEVLVFLACPFALEGEFTLFLLLLVVGDGGEVTDADVVVVVSVIIRSGNTFFK